MRKFFFHLVYDDRTADDLEGSDLLDLETAYVEAKAIIREFAAAHLTTGKPFLLRGVRIGSQSGRVLAEVSAAEGISEIIPPGLFAEHSLPQA